MIMFGIIEIILAQIPDLSHIWWLSIVAAAMSFTYSTIGVGLALSRIIGMLPIYRFQTYVYIYLHEFLALKKETTY